MKHFATFLIGWFFKFKMKFNPLPDLLNIGYKIIEIRFVLWWRTSGSENKQIADFFGLVKTLYIVFEFFWSSLKHSTYFLKNWWWIVIEGNFLNFYYGLSNFIKCFGTCSWKLFTRNLLLKIICFTLIFESSISLIFLRVQLFVISILCYLAILI